MKDSIRLKLENLLDRQEELNALLSDPGTQGDQNLFRKLSIELSEISPVLENYLEYKALEEDADGAQLMIEEDDSDNTTGGGSNMTLFLASTLGTRGGQASSGAYVSDLFTGLLRGEINAGVLTARVSGSKSIANTQGSISAVFFPGTREPDNGSAALFGTIAGSIAGTPIGLSFVYLFVNGDEIESGCLESASNRLSRQAERLFIVGVEFPIPLNEKSSGPK